MAKNKKPKKKKFEVTKDETIQTVLQQMREEGYQPVKRMEKPVFYEKNNEIIISHQEIVFEGILIKNEQ